jgi:hypothetical protein
VLIVDLTAGTGRFKRSSSTFSSGWCGAPLYRSPAVNEDATLTLTERFRWGDEQPAKTVASETAAEVWGYSTRRVK